MTRNIADLRKDYKKERLTGENLPEEPFSFFEAWFNQALETEGFEANAMHLATTGENGKPTLRVVLLKGFDEKGFVFFTNYESEKGRHLKQNPFCALNFFWAGLERQVRIEGKAEKVSVAESEEYFDSRPEYSRIAAIASPQSQIVESREELEQKFSDVEKKWQEKPLKRPPHWGGYRVKPERIEFWQGRESRFHDRIRYTHLENKEWTRHRLAP